MLPDLPRSYSRELSRACGQWTALAPSYENLNRSQAFCAVSTGIYGYPIEDATHIAMDEVRTYLESEKGKKVSRLSMFRMCTHLGLFLQIERVIFCVWSDKDKSVYE
jgi:O-acetyl-ADP-ribose deacetylase (regulator of RNase III)